MLQQNKGGNSFLSQGEKLYFYCGKLGHTVHFCNKLKNQEQENVKNTDDDDDVYAFVVRNEAHFKIMYKWIIDTHNVLQGNIQYI